MNQDLSKMTPRTTPESAGSILREVREEKGIPAELVAHALKMRPQQIIELEQDDHAHLPHPSYVRLLILYYAKYLDIPASRIEPHLPDKREFQSSGYQTVCSSIPLESSRTVRKTREAQTSSLPGRVLPTIITCCIVLVLFAIGGAAYFTYNQEHEKAVLSTMPVAPPPQSGITKKRSTPSLDAMRTFDSALLEKVPRLTKVGPAPLRLSKGNNIPQKAELVQNASRMGFRPTSPARPIFPPPRNAHHR